jgi:prevent-host-death family protein
MFQGKKPDIPFVDPSSIKRAKTEDEAARKQGKLLQLVIQTQKVYTTCVHKKKPTKTKVGIRNFRSNMGRFLRRARSGEVIVLTSHNREVAEIRPATPWSETKRRRPGALKGRIKIAPDFDTLPDEMIEAFEG